MRDEKREQALPNAPELTSGKWRPAAVMVAATTGTGDDPGP